MTLKQKDEAFELLKNYNGENPYLLKLKREVYSNKNIDIIGDFQVEYIIKNYNSKPIIVNKIVSIVDWYGEKKKEEWCTNFTPSKIKILALLGETKSFYHCMIQYRQSVPSITTFIPKNALLNDFLCGNYLDIEVDFNRYDRLSTSKDPNRRLKEHQKEGVKFLLDRKKCILADGMGMGKTSELAVAAIEGNFDCVLIICPASLKTNWKDELMWYIPEKDISIINGFNGLNKSELEELLGYAKGKSNLKKEELLNEAKDKGKWNNNRFVIVNYDILDEFYTKPKSWQKKSIDEAYDKSPMLQYIKDKKTLLIIDEAHRLSNNDSDRYDIVRDLIKRGNPHSIYLATGTPVTNNPKNLYCLLQLLDQPITNDWEYYMKRYCNAMKIPAKGEKARLTDIFLKNKKKRTWYDLTPNEKDELKEYINSNAKKITITTGNSNLEELKMRISHIYLRRVKEDMDDMVNKTVHDVRYELTPTQRDEYNRLWEEYENEKKNEDPEKELNKDLLEGAVYRKYLSNQMIPNTIKLVDSIITNGEKVIIATCYDEELYTLRDYYDDKCVIFNGKIDSKKKDAAVKSFMNDENIKVFIGNIQACGVGLTLTSAHKLVFNNISFVPSDNQQMEDRIVRIGQKYDCDIYYQIFNDTQYEKMINIVIDKTNVINNIIKKESEK